MLAGTSINAATLASDVGDNYNDITDPWVTGSNLGTGFGDWGFFDGAGSFYQLQPGSFLGSTADLGGNGFALVDGNGGALRGLMGELSDGQTFSVDMAGNFRSGFKGISLRNEAGNSDIMSLTISGDDYQFDGANISGLAGASGDWGYNANTVLNLAVTRDGADLDVLVTRSGGTTASFSTTVAGGGDAGFDQFSIFSSLAGPLDENAIIFNNLNVVPEPGTVTLLFGALGILAIRKQRRKTLNRT